jgi:hypothetical protein
MNYSCKKLCYTVPFPLFEYCELTDVAGQSVPEKGAFDNDTTEFGLAAEVDIVRPLQANVLLSI